MRTPVTAVTAEGRPAPHAHRVPRAPRARWDFWLEAIAVTTFFGLATGLSIPYQTSDIATWSLPEWFLPVEGLLFLGGALLGVRQVIILAVGPHTRPRLFLLGLTLALFILAAMLVTRALIPPS